jgi:hypothetical protein
MTARDDAVAIDLEISVAAHVCGNRDHARARADRGLRVIRAEPSVGHCAEADGREFFGGVVDELARFFDAQKLSANDDRDAGQRCQNQEAFRQAHAARGALTNDSACELASPAIGAREILALESLVLGMSPGQRRQSVLNFFQASWVTRHGLPKVVQPLVLRRFFVELERIGVARFRRR